MIMDNVFKVWCTWHMMNTAYNEGAQYMMHGTTYDLYNTWYVWYVGYMMHDMTSATVMMHRV